jgi:hypothetical protein
MTNLVLRMLLKAKRLAVMSAQRRNQQGHPKHLTLKRMNAFSEHDFRQEFRFRKVHFRQILRNLDWTHDDGEVKWFRIGKPGHTRWVPADWLLMATLCRFAKTGVLRDIGKVVGGDGPWISMAVDYTTAYIEERYGDRLEDIEEYTGRFREFADHMKHTGKVPLDNLVCFVDGHNLGVGRPGGAGCVKENFDQSSLYSFKEKSCTLLFQAMVFPCGLACVWGPFVGRRSDPWVWGQTGAENVFRRMEQDGRGRWCAFGDRIYHLSQYFLRPFKRAANQPELSTAEKEFNVEMSRARIHVEQWFANVRNTFPFFQFRGKMKVGDPSRYP